MLTGNLQIKKLSHYFLITILWCLCVGVLAFFSVDVSAQSAETVKVGYYFSNNFQEKSSYILDADIKSFFNHLDHKWIMKFVESKIKDQRS